MRKIFVWSAAALCLAAGPALSQSSPYYITDGDSSIAYIVQNGVLVDSFTTFDLAYPLSVRQTVIIHHRDDEEAVEYTLAGVPTGTTYTGNSGFTELLDGTTDGVQFNYAIECCGDGTHYVVRTDLFWQGSEILFELPDDIDGQGITYDTAAGTLFVSTFSDALVRELDLAGNVLNSYASPVGSDTCCLAYEEATDTLWLKANGGGTIYQLNKATGAVLDTIAVPGFPPSNDYGGEMPIAAVPPPSVLEIPTVGEVGLAALIALLALSGVLLLGRTR